MGHAPLYTNNGYKSCNRYFLYKNVEYDLSGCFVLIGLKSDFALYFACFLSCCFRLFGRPQGYAPTFKNKYKKYFYLLIFLYYCNAIY